MDKITNHLDAFNLMIAKLDNSGIAYERRQSSQTDNQDIITKYSDRLPNNEWSIIVFKNYEQDKDKIYALREELNDLGISFDSSGGCGEYQWEADWAFQWKSFKDKFIESMDYIKSLDWFEYTVEKTLPNGQKYCSIINVNSNIGVQDMLPYIESAYDEEFRLKVNNSIQIVRFRFIDKDKQNDIEKIVQHNDYNKLTQLANIYDDMCRFILP